MGSVISRAALVIPLLEAYVTVPPPVHHLWWQWGLSVADRRLGNSAGAIGMVTQSLSRILEGAFWAGWLMLFPCRN